MVYIETARRCTHYDCRQIPIRIMYTCSHASGNSTSRISLAVRSSHSVIAGYRIHNEHRTTYGDASPTHTRNYIPVLAASELYWCVSKPFKHISETRLCIEDCRTIESGRDLCNRLRESYNMVRGFLGKYISWKKCLGIEFTSVSALTPTS